MPERFALALSLISAIAVLFCGLYSRWDFGTTLVSTLGAMLLGLLVGRFAGWLGAWQMAEAVGRKNEADERGQQAQSSTQPTEKAGT